MIIHIRHKDDDGANKPEIYVTLCNPNIYPAELEWTWQNANNELVDKPTCETCILLHFENPNNTYTEEEH